MKKLIFALMVFTMVLLPINIDVEADGVVVCKVDTKELCIQTGNEIDCCIKIVQE